MPEPRAQFPVKHGRDHRIGGADPIPFQYAKMPFVHLNGNLVGQTVPSGSDYFPELTGLEVVPLNAGGTVDSEVFGAIDPSDVEIDIETGGSSNEPFKSIHIKKPGLYYFSWGIGWYLNWGMVRCNYDIQHDDGEQSVITTRIFLHSSESTYFGGFSDATAPQVGIEATTYIAVDERATNVHVRGLIHNVSGSSRTYGTDPATNLGGLGLFIVQLSPNGYSNPPAIPNINPLAS